MAPLHKADTPFPRRRPELPAFCRTRRRSITVSINSLAALRLLVLLGLLFQLSTLLLVIAGPVPPRLVPMRATAVFHPDPETAAAGSPLVTPLSNR